MANIYKLQVPADVHLLLQLLNRLGFRCGPLMAARMIKEEKKVEVWMVPLGPNGIKRVSARLLRGERTTIGDSRRRVYEDLRVQTADGSWREVTEQDYLVARLGTPDQYGE